MSSSLVRLVIPAYNEGRRLPDYLPRLCEALSKVPFPWRITIVDDGSREEDSRRMQECVRLCGSRVEFHRLPVNLGKGGAVYSGWDSDHESEWLGLLDADGSIPPHEVVRLLIFLERLIHQTPFLPPAARYLAARSRDLGCRHVGGRVFATLVSVATGIPVYDSQCGFKLLRRRCYEAVRGRLREKRFAFDVELLVALRQSGAKSHRGAHRLVRCSGQQVAFCSGYSADARSRHRHADETRS